ncbi:hypothetical protein COU91_02635 [Candidatus Saccharibacteria bacterium CG10_big_fil_rev_8_21_14_0_10_47_8]|nr:MAG: hypothetical protein COU91_02635 [Candidatus Saccharibacteria bacterium CG10_big_fil_rev_8_21_14_0_10_47_8]
MKNSYRNNFAFKLSASKYHIQQIQNTYKANRISFESGIDTPEIRPIYYHYHAVIFELCSALEMTLQAVNDQKELGIEVDKVAWKNQPTRFQQKLLEKNPLVYSILEEAHSQEWNIALRETRNQLTHRGNISLQVEFSESGLTIINPIINKTIFHFDINLWGEEISELFNKLYEE